MNDDGESREQLISQIVQAKTLAFIEMIRTVKE